jgi:hypothetical protein
VIFVWFGAEELGLLGSRWFVKHAPEAFPASRMAAMINLDMVGRNPARPCAVYGLGTDEGDMLEELAGRAVRAAGLEARLIQAGGWSGGDSDHIPFREAGVPSIFFFAGPHADWHRPADHAERLDYARMARIGRAALELLLSLADDPRRPKFDPGCGRPPVRDFRLGATPEYMPMEDAEIDALGLGRSEGDLRIESVRPASAAERAGLKPGDVVVAIGGEPLPRTDPEERFTSIVAERAGPFATLELDVRRGSEKKVLKASWGGRLGVRTRVVEPAPDGGALEIEAVEPGGPAEKAGLKPGDVLLSIGGDSLPRRGGPESLSDLLDRRCVRGASLEIEIARRQERLKIAVSW